MSRSCPAGPFLAVLGNTRHAVVFEFADSHRHDDAAAGEDANIRARPNMSTMYLIFHVPTLVDEIATCASSIAASTISATERLCPR